MMKVAIIGAGIVGSTAAYYLSKEAQVDVTVYDHGEAKRPRQQRALSVPGFLNGGIRLGIAWLVWEQIFTKNW